MVMYKIDRWGGPGGGSKNRSLGRTRKFKLVASYQCYKRNSQNVILK